MTTGHNQAPLLRYGQSGQSSKHVTHQIVTVPAAEMRYDTLGDWRYPGEWLLIIEVSDAVPENERFLVALHELVEAELCWRHGITQKMVDEFDLGFKGEGEPGDDPNAPYRREHRVAMLVEHLVALEMGIDGYGEVR